MTSSLDLDPNRLIHWAARALGVLCAAVLIGSGAFAIVAGVLGVLNATRIGLVLATTQLSLPNEVIAVLGIAVVAGGAVMLAETLRPSKQDAQQRADQLQAQRAVLDAQLRETAAQEERNRLARDLHDTIKQQLFSINVAAATAQSLRERDPDAAAQHIQQVRTLSQAASVEMKALLTQLRPQPLVTTGLVGAIEEQLDALRFRSEVQIEFTHDTLPDEAQLPLGAQEAVFRVVQEALANVARHARAGRVVVEIKRVLRQAQESNVSRAAHLSTAAQSGAPAPRRFAGAGAPAGADLVGIDLLQITVRDDGQGFDMSSARAGMGMSNMRARVSELGGTFDVTSSPGNGTTLTMHVPLQHARDTLEAQRREKDERGQRAHLASALLGFAVMFVAIFAITLFAVGPRMTATNDNRTALPLIVTLGTAMMLPIVIAAIGFRRRALALDDTTGIWHKLLRSYDLMQISYLLLTAAWVMFSFRLFLPTLAVAGIAVFLLVNTVQLQRELNARIGEWATVRGLQTRLNEQVVFLVFGVGFIALVFAGVFGDIQRTRLFHESFDQRWFTSFLVIAYPLLIAGSLPGLALIRHQIRRLKAIEGDVADEISTPTMPSDLRRQRIGARLSTVGFVIIVTLIGLFIKDQGWLVIIVMFSAAALLLILKFRIERVLTVRLREWTTLYAQTAAQRLYAVFLAFALLGVVSGLIGGVIGATSPKTDATFTTAPLGVLLAISMVIFASPLWLGLMTLITRKRIGLLQATEVRA